MPEHLQRVEINRINRRFFIGGSDARIIMGDDQAALIRLWREKRGVRRVGRRDRRRARRRRHTVHLRLCAR